MRPEPRHRGIGGCAHGWWYRTDVPPGSTEGTRESRLFAGCFRDDVRQTVPKCVSTGSPFKVERKYLYTGAVLRGCCDDFVLFSRERFCFTR